MHKMTLYKCDKCGKELPPRITRVFTWSYDGTEKMEGRIQLCKNCSHGAPEPASID